MSRKKATLTLTTEEKEALCKTMGTRGLSVEFSKGMVLLKNQKGEVISKNAEEKLIGLFRLSPTPFKKN